jgi:alpha-glucosidase (family GH31 glycosyl hydrolase)
MKYIIRTILFVLIITCSCSKESKLTVVLYEGEKAWAGVIKDGHYMPFVSGYEMDFYGNNKGNQLQPLIITSKGQYVWSEEAYRFEIKNGKILIDDPLKKVVSGRHGGSLAEVYMHVNQKYFPPSGFMPDEMLFTAPQYNTWIELNFNHNQEDIIKYARAIIDNGLPPGVFMIDDTWQEDYGIWDFHPGRFPDPKAMMDELHALGFKVMLWLCPFVSPDQRALNDILKNKKALVLEKINPDDTWETATEPFMVRWWNGVSAVLDLTNPAAVDWFNEQMDRLVKDYNVDGFKLDGGDSYFYTDNMLTMEPATPYRHMELWAELGLRFPLNEYRATWKMGGQPLAQRLHDKNHDWDDLQKLIPQMIVMGIMGYPFACPDMIGGGEIKSFLTQSDTDQELVVRSAQCHALMPMMQFSVAPWRVLDKEHMAAVKKAVDLRSKFIPLIMELAKHAAKTGEPILKSMDYVFPGQGYELTADQFMMGDSLLVAPLVTPGQDGRYVYLPEGFWMSDENECIEGGKKHFVKVSLTRLPYFKRLKENQQY